MAEAAVNWAEKPYALQLDAKPTMGADPEIFVKSGHKLIPAFKFLPPKDKGLLVTHDFWSNREEGTRKNLGSVYWDGFQAEWRHKEGSSCIALLTLKQQAALKTLLKAAKKYDDKARLVLENVVKIPSEALETEQDQHIELGCLPSMNAYDDSGIHVDNPRELLFRFAGGHMHFGHDDIVRLLTEEKMVDIVKNLDSVLGVWAVGAAQSFDNPIRRRYYGKAGEYRRPKYGPKKHIQGLEYRTLSNFHLASPYTFNMVYELGRIIYNLSWSKAFDLWASDEFETRTAINECDVKMAQGILKRNEGMFKWILRHHLTNPNVINIIYKTGLNGIDSVIKKPEDFEGNWELNEKDWVYNASHPTATLGGGVVNGYVKEL